MKKITSTFVLLFLFAFVNAQVGQAVLFTENGERFTLILNGLRQNEKPETNVKLTGLTAPQYKLKVLFDDPRIAETSFNLFVEPGLERTFSISKNSKGKYTMRFISESPIVNAQPTPPQTPTPPTPPTPNTQTYSQTQQNTATDNFNMNINVDGMGMSVNTSATGINMNVSTTGGAPVPPPPPPAVVYVPGYTGPIGCERPLFDNDFRDLKSTIASKTFEDTKLTIAKQVLRDHCLLTAQVKELTALFTFEETKLDFAKYAYDFTYDRGNYFKLNDVFTFESSIEELDRYIGSRR
ncbi:MAG: DUF4476 domain-containing protein [Bacteroidia bacterium]|nr:DUF4476 domain-containing protein [Bacteroidia bacterium]